MLNSKILGVNEVYAMLGKKIKEIRLLRDMKQDELAMHLNVKGGTISNWERGTSNPNPDELRTLSKILGVPSDYLLEIGTYENWSEMQENRPLVLKQIAQTMKNMSYDILERIDELTYIRLVNAFNVKISCHEDGVGISVDSIIPSYSNELFNPRMQEDDDWLSLIHSLGADGQRQLKGYIDCLIQIQSSELKQAK